MFPNYCTLLLKKKVILKSQVSFILISAVMKYSVQQTLTNKPFSRHQFETRIRKTITDPSHGIMWAQFSGSQDQPHSTKSVWQNDLHQVETEVLISLIRPLGGDAKSTNTGEKSPAVLREIQVQSCVCQDESPVPFTVLALKLFNRRGISI